MNKFLTIKCLCLLAWSYFAPQIGQCQPATEPEPAKKKTVFDLFKLDEITELTITADFDSIKANLRNKSYVSGKFEVVHSRKNRTSLPVKLRTRGKSRRMMCDFPPIKLKFDKENLDSNGLETFNDFKLVTHCLEGVENEVNIMREYLTYQLYNVLTPYSFKASLVKITYKNTGQSFKKSVHIGIIIEDVEIMAHRNYGKTLESKVINLDSLHINQEKITAVFQYMVGNADWSYAMARNMEMIQMEDGHIVTVPYDFDYSGIVKAPYARANAALGQRTVLDRVFLGNSKTYEELNPVFNYFETKKAELLQTIDDFEILDIAFRDEMKEYIEGFYSIIEDRTRVENEMLARVKKG